MIKALQTKVRKGLLSFDRAQEKAAKRLTNLQNLLSEYEKARSSKTTNYFNNDSSKKLEPSSSPTTPIRIPRGYYIHGQVGTGKSMLMDLFYHTTIPEIKKHRYHYHNFMQQIHTSIISLKKQDLKTHGRNFHIDINPSRNPINRVANQLSSEMTLLCLDEFQVIDVADAVILSQLFSELFRQGVVVVCTSNIPPKDLYLNGINREYFLPFVDLIQKHCIEINFAGTSSSSSETTFIDYRRFIAECSKNALDKNSQGGEKNKNLRLDDYFLTFESQQEARTKCNEIFDMISSTGTTANEYFLPREHSSNELLSDSTHIPIGYNRTMKISSKNLYQNKIIRFSFMELCETELASSDYHAIAKQFPVIMIDDVPTITLEQHNSTRRFITLIDELYENKCCLICSTFVAHSIDHLFLHDDNSRIKLTAGESASVTELAFALNRAKSRLFEICSKSWFENYSTR